MSESHNEKFERSRQKNNVNILECEYDDPYFSRRKGSSKKKRDKKKKVKNERQLGYYREIIKVKLRQNVEINVGDPQQFVISDSISFLDQKKAKFGIDFKVGKQVQKKIITRADELKNMISPIQKIWGSIVKQYLNDSEFVQIYRKNKGNFNENIRYGKSIICYDDGQIQNESKQNKQEPIFSRAYFKLWEILSLGVFDGRQGDNLRIGSLAEGPGGFIHSMIDFRNKSGKKNDEFYAITLLMNEKTRNSKDWSDCRGKEYLDRKIEQGFKIKRSYGGTGSGNLLQWQNVQYFSQVDLDGVRCDLVTGDGGIECVLDSEYEYQELFNVKLFYAQILVALKIQKKGGKFILKIYDVLFDVTKQLILLLCVYYGKVRLIKPVTSRPGNSEKYLLCEDFQGIQENEEMQLKRLFKMWVEAQPNVSYFENELFVYGVLNFENLGKRGEIIERIEKMNSFMVEEQVMKLEEGLKLVEGCKGDVDGIQEGLRERRFDEQIIYAYNWCKKYGINCKDVKIVKQL